jgi:hypothetical protein
MTFRSHVIWTVLASAQHNDDAMVTATCRRLIVANRLGWRKHRDPKDWAMVRAFYDELRAA